ncbi:MAG: CBS domain-containing protein [Deltaproteobacteria bacterium]|nr:CBS domain-containing protein [Deltaproteobacteria bacterium]MBW2445386.1 CBS domain-containing protein [Deltaproteobacteria bacterium]
MAKQRPARGKGVFDASILKQPMSVLPQRSPLCFSREQFVSEAMHAMQKEHRGCVLVTDDGGMESPLAGIFTERDVLYRIIDRGRNPATLPLQEVMTRSPDALLSNATVAFVLNRMAVGGFRHVPVVDENDHPVAIISVRDVVEFLVDHFPREIMNLPPQVGANITTSREGA